jgi:hypothetical protein
VGPPGRADDQRHALREPGSDPDSWTAATSYQKNNPWPCRLN